MKIPFVDLKKEWAFFESDFNEKFLEFGRAGNYVLGKYTEEFEQDFARYCGYQYGVAVSTGLAALEVSLLAQGIRPDDNVITAANSAVATSLAISRVGAKPVFCGIKDDFLIDENQIENLIDNKTKAILPVHLFGRVCNMTQINEIAKRHDLKIIEDACQAHGAGFGGESAINTKAFSFYPTKNLGSLGEGGMIVTNSEEIKDFASCYRNYGQQGRYNHVIKGDNLRMNALQCALLNVKLKQLDDFVGKRRGIAKKYIESLSSIDNLVINEFDPVCSYHLFVIRVLQGKRQPLMEYLSERGIDCLIHYPTAIHQQPCYINEIGNISLLVTDQFQSEIISLPCNPFLEDSEQDYIIENIINYFK